MCYQIDDRELVKIKNSVYSIEDLVGEDVSGYAGGTCLVFRLAMNDYHRYCYVDSGKLIRTKHIKGCLHTVSSLSDKYRVYVQNDRIINILETNHFGEIIQIECDDVIVAIGFRARKSMRPELYGVDAEVYEIVVGNGIGSIASQVNDAYEIARHI